MKNTAEINLNPPRQKKPKKHRIEISDTVIYGKRSQPVVCIAFPLVEVWAKPKEKK